MTTSEMLDTLSDRILSDDRILSPQERDLVSRLLRRAKSSSDPSGKAAIETIGDTIGEIVAERTYGSLGTMIAERLVRESSLPRTPTPLQMGTPPGPTPPSGPQDPVGPHPPGPNPPGISRLSYERRSSISDELWLGTPPGSTPPGPQDPNGPHPPGPNPPGISRVSEPSLNAVATQVDEDSSKNLASDILHADCVILDEFLPASELRALSLYALQREKEFRVSEVVSPGVLGGAVDYERRRSRMLDIDPLQSVVVQRLRSGLPRALRGLGHAEFDITRVEAQITASNDGDFFRWHSDNAQEKIARREITFVYFFHREPKPFLGGELRIYDSRREHGAYVPMANHRTIVPEQNQMVLFNSSLAHEVTRVENPSRAFADSRFTVNGWLHR